MPEISPQDPYPWPAAVATGTGPMPGTDPGEALRVIFGELPGLPHLPELPARGPGAGPAGRAIALLVDLPAEITASGWRFAARPGRDLTRARSLLSADLDALEEAAVGYQGPLKVAVTGPWTLAASIELSRSQDPALADAGAVADLTESLAEGTAAYLDQVHKRVPGATVALQIDEPSLPAVAAGAIPTASGLYRLPAPDGPGLQAGLHSLISAVPAFTIVHCAAVPVPFSMIIGAGAGAVGLSLGLLRRDDEDALAEAVEAGLGILAGVVPAAAAVNARPAAGQDQRAGPPGPGNAKRPGAGNPPPARWAAEQVITLWRRMGWPSPRRPGAVSGPAGLAGQVVLMPSTGLDGITPGQARAVLARCREAARLLPELIEEGSW